MLLSQFSISTVESNCTWWVLHRISIQETALLSFLSVKHTLHYLAPYASCLVTHVAYLIILASYIIHANQDLNFDVCTWWNTIVTGSDDGTACESNCNRVWDCAKRKWDNTDCVSKRNQCYEF